MSTIYCSSCGKLNLITSKYCVKCTELLHNDSQLQLNNTINSFKELFSTEYENKLNDKIITFEDYNTVINNIIETGKSRIIYKKNQSTLEKVQAIAKSYVPVIHKEIGNNYGEYAYNVICIDENFDPAIQIATLLHELTHHLFTEILEQLLSYIWEVKKTAIIESLIQTTTSIPSILLISEYCASNIEKYYLPAEYVSYSSFNSILNDIGYNKNVISTSLIVGTAMSNDICKILSSFIDKSLEEDIKQEFIKHKTKPMAKEIGINDSTTINNALIRNVFILRLLVKSYKTLQDPEYMHLLERNKELFEKSYKKGAI